MYPWYDQPSHIVIMSMVSWQHDSSRLLILIVVRILNLTWKDFFLACIWDMRYYKTERMLCKRFDDGHHY
jgi:hypothetical protein